MFETPFESFGTISRSISGKVQSSATKWTLRPFQSEIGQYPIHFEQNMNFKPSLQFSNDSQMLPNSKKKVEIGDLKPCQIFQSLNLLQKWMLAQLTPMIQNQQLDAKRR